MSGHWKQQFVFSSQPHSITVTNAFVPIPANHFPAFTTSHSLILFNMEIMHILDHDLFLVFLGLLLSLAPGLQNNTFFTQSSSSFHKTCPYHCSIFLYTVLYVVFLTTALILCATIDPLISHHTSI